MTSNVENIEELDFDVISADTGINESAPITIPVEIDYSDLKFAQYFKNTFIDELAHKFLVLLIQKAKNNTFRKDEIEVLVKTAFDFAEAYMQERAQRGIRF